MKIKMSILLCFMGLVSTLFAQRGGFESRLDCSNYNGFINSRAFQRLQPQIRQMYPNGTIRFDRTRGGGVSSVEELKPYLGLNEDYTFELVKTTESNRLGRKRVYHTYQQYYRGVEVENGRIILTGDDDDPCDLDADVQISTDIDLNIPDGGGCVLSDLQLNRITGVRDVNARLVIAPNLKNDCSFHLAQRVDGNSTTSGFYGTFYVDPCTGELIHIINVYSDGGNIANAEDTEYGSPIDVKVVTEVGEKSGLMCENDQIRIYENCTTTICNNRPCITSNFSNDDLICPVTSDPIALDVFNMAQATLNAYSNLGFDFDEVHLIIDCDGLIGALSSPNSHSSTSIVHFDPATLQCDMIAHEIAHSILNDFNINGGATNEGLADIFAMYAESFCQGGTDWIFGNGIPILEETDKFRDLSIPTCIDDVTEGTIWDQGEVLGSWFYQYVVVGDLDITEAMNLIIEVLETFPPDGSIEDFILTFMTEADFSYGVCSNEADAIRAAASEVCIDISDTTYDCDYSIEGNTSEGSISGTGGTLEVCEEDDENSDTNGLTLFTNPLVGEDAVYRWYLPVEWEVQTTNGTTNGGVVETSDNYINITSFSDYPYYPQYFDICIYSPSIGVSKGCIQIKLTDCDGDDPTCEDYHGVGRIITDDNIETRSRNSVTPKAVPHFLQVYTLTGLLVYQGIPTSLFGLLQMKRNQIFTCIYHDDKGNVLKIQKYLHIQ